MVDSPEPGSLDFVEDTDEAKEQEVADGSLDEEAGETAVTVQQGLGQESDSTQDGSQDRSANSGVDTSVRDGNGGGPVPEEEEFGNETARDTGTIQAAETADQNGLGGQNEDAA